MGDFFLLFVGVLKHVRIGVFLPSFGGQVGRLKVLHATLARVLIDKVVFDISPSARHVAMCLSVMFIANATSAHGRIGPL